MANQPKPMLSSRLVLVTGKGGVGKTLVSAALAEQSARRASRVLWVEMAARPRGGDVFAEYLPRYATTQLDRSLWATHLQLQPAIEEYLGIIFRVPLLARMISNNALFQVLTAATPGLDSLVMLGKIWYEFERRDGSKPYWDQIIVDAPATGHGLSLLRLPVAALGVVSRGPVADRAADINDMLSDTTKTSIVVVTQAEALAVDETMDLIRSVAMETPYTVGQIVLNNVLTDFGDCQGRYQKWVDGGSDSALRERFGSHESAARAWMQLRERRRKLQDEQRARLFAAELPIFEIPWLAESCEKSLRRQMSRSFR